MSNLKRRMDALGTTLATYAPGAACATCGAPGRLKRGMAVIVMQDQEAASHCPGCARRVDPRDGRPLADDCTLVVLIRDTPPAANPRDDSHR